MEVRFLGHSGFYIQMKGHHLIFDPYITPNDDPLAKKIDVDSIKADYIFLTHGHGDHIADAEKIAKNNDATIVSNYEISTYFGQKGLKTYPLNQGGKKSFDFGIVKYVNAIHSSSFPDGSYAGNPGGFVIWNDDNSFYHSGDTALTMDLKLIPLMCPALDFAIFPIGDNFTMGYEDAVLAADMVECDKVIGCHYNTFGYIEIDIEDAKSVFANAQKKLYLPAIGETITV